jgi:putative two-component system response regulator
MPISHGPILIVDDEPANLALLREILEPDYLLVFARNGAEALEAVAKHRPSLILLDIQMPNLDGYAVCRALKAMPEYEGIPVIFVTGLSDMGDEEAGFSVGCVDYLIKPISAGTVRARVRTHLSLVRISQLESSQRDAIFMLGTAGHYKDNDTGVHVWRMAAMSRELARAAGWSEQECELLELAATMHDTGKIGIADAVLRKPGKLDAEEWLLMKNHCQIGYDILSKSQAPVFRLAAEVALYHHEKWDGSGYPMSLSGENIPESARIVAVVDVFDALTMKRPYKDAWPLEQAFQYLNDSSGQHFEPRLIRHVTDILPRLRQIKAEWDQREQTERRTGS